MKRVVEPQRKAQYCERVANPYLLSLRRQVRRIERYDVFAEGHGGFEHFQYRDENLDAIGKVLAGLVIQDVPVRDDEEPIVVAEKTLALVSAREPMYVPMRVTARSTASTPFGWSRLKSERL